MFAPRALIYMTGVLIAFAVTTYMLTGSVYTTLIQTVICAVLVQVGYFCAVLFLVWKARKAEKAASPGNTAASSAGPSGEKEASVKPVAAPFGGTPGSSTHSGH